MPEIIFGPPGTIPGLSGTVFGLPATTSGLLGMTFGWPELIFA
jgi:hypothetical protein